MNLLIETKEKLAEHGKTLDDVVAICCSDFQITKEDFIKYSNTSYDASYGSPEVANDLLVIGNDYWLERHEYDGAEWWEYKTMPKYENLPFKHITALTVGQTGEDWCGWRTLAELNLSEIGGAE